MRPAVVIKVYFKRLQMDHSQNSEMHPCIAHTAWYGGRLRSSVTANQPHRDRLALVFGFRARRAVVAAPPALVKYDTFAVGIGDTRLFTCLQVRYFSR